LRHFGSAEKAWKSSASDLELILKPSLTSKFLEFREKFDFVAYSKHLDNSKISWVCQFEKEYPEMLKQIPDAPIVLYTKGDKSLLLSENKIAIVGTRHITHYGREVTEMFSSQLSEAGLTIVSGMAYGVDGIAHSACLNSNGRTIAVLGNGVDLPYPRENQKLYEEILDSGNLIVSEYPPGTPPSIGSFPARNRIVAGISDAILVTEGAQDSGSLITANFGLDFGHKVFAVPGPITSSLSAAPLRLIEKGAKLVVSSEDVLKELEIKTSELKSNMEKFKNLSKEEKKIIELIENEGLSFDEIVHRTKFDSSKTATILSMMEIKDLIRNIGGVYMLLK
jgi:DNA processing protein